MTRVWRTAGVILILAASSIAWPAFAHVLKTDGSIGAVLHIDPDDDPIAGSQSSFFFEFKDVHHTFSPENCNCTFAILEQGKTIFSQPLFQNNTSPSLTNASIFYTFPKRDVYVVRVMGEPLTPNGFQPFVLNYDVRVARSAVASTTPTAPGENWFSVHIIHLIGIIGASIFMVFFILKERRAQH